jgi:hypothetical protein
MAKSKLGYWLDKGKSKLGFDANHNASLTKLKIGKTYSVFLNPNQISHSIRIDYIQQDGLTVKNNVKKIAPASTKPESLSFTLMLDGTGSTGSLTNISEEISNLMAVTYHPLVKPEDKQTEIEIKWGTTIDFMGYLESFEVIYTLFKPNGEPLRATVALLFIGKSVLTKVGDLHRTIVKEIEVDSVKTIVNLCKMTYNTPAVYIALAKANKLATVRKLKPGIKLFFPPLKEL